MDLLTKLNNYYESPALSQSMMKALLAGIGTYSKEKEDLFREDPQHFILGSAVDSLLLTSSVFDKQFHISKLENKPSDTVMAITREVFSNKEDLNFSLNQELIYNTCNNRNYYANLRKDNIKDDTRIAKVIKQAQDYWNELIAASGRTILSIEDMLLIESIVTSFKSHPFTRDYFSTGLTELAQLDIYFEYRGLNCKALLDLVLIDRDAKTIQPIDIKTLGRSTKAFPVSAKRFRYDIQGAWYTLALKQSKEIRVNEYLNIDTSEYTVLPFKFIVESVDSPGLCPLVYTMTPMDYYTGTLGFVTQTGEVLRPRVNGIISSEFAGYEQAIDLYKWHVETEIWDMDKELYEQNGELSLNVFTK